MAELAGDIDSVTDLDRLCVSVSIFPRHAEIGGLFAIRCGRSSYSYLRCIGRPGYPSHLSIMGLRSRESTGGVFPEGEESLVSETYDRTIHHISDCPDWTSDGAYQQACCTLGFNVGTVSDQLPLVLCNSLFGPLRQLNIPHR